MLRSYLLGSMKAALKAFLLLSTVSLQAANESPWTLGEPIVTYWCGPAMTDAAAAQMAEGGWNLVWCTEKDLDLVHRHGLRAQLQSPLLAPGALDDPSKRQKLDEFIERVRKHPALYAYYIIDEPSAGQFAALGRLTAYLKEHDPAHLAYINLFPTYATNEQLGNKGDRVTAYNEHLKQFIEHVKPSLISYDHYQFAVAGDMDQYFLNLSLIRRAALGAGVPFLNIVQACSWTPSMRVPNGDEMRYLLYTSLAYGAEGISYYIYSCAGHTGGIAAADGTPTPLYHALKTLNREFAAIARELQPLQSLSVYHAGMTPRGAEGISSNAWFSVQPPLPPVAPKAMQPVTGVLFGTFGPHAGATTTNSPTHAVVVNLDYKSAHMVPVRAFKKVQLFDSKTTKWSDATGPDLTLNLLPGGGVLLRVSP